MANWLELRGPFLDKEVFEVARHIPISQKITRNQSKVAMRKALAAGVPAGGSGLPGGACGLHHRRLPG